MKENIKTVADYLENAPKGTKLYSPVCGDCTLYSVDDTGISVTDDSGHFFYFNLLGQYKIYAECNGECLLFPSKDIREWTDYQSQPIFKPYDKIIGRNVGGCWVTDLFSHYPKNSLNMYKYCGMGGVGYDECLPYNEETAKLVGTTEDYKVTYQ